MTNQVSFLFGNNFDINLYRVLSRLTEEKTNALGISESIVANKNKKVIEEVINKSVMQGKFPFGSEYKEEICTMLLNKDIPLKLVEAYSDSEAFMLNQIESASEIRYKEAIDAFLNKDVNRSAKYAKQSLELKAEVSKSRHKNIIKNLNNLMKNKKDERIIAYLSIEDLPVLSMDQDYTIRAEILVDEGAIPYSINVINKSIYDNIPITEEVASKTLVENLALEGSFKDPVSRYTIRYLVEILKPEESNNIARSLYANKERSINFAENINQGRIIAYLFKNYPKLKNDTTYKALVAEFV